MCKYCAIDFSSFSTSQKANHTRWCQLNPGRSESVKKLAVARRSRSPGPISEKHKSKISEAWKSGKYANADFGAYMKEHGHTDQTKKKISEAALASNHRRLLKSTRSYTCRDGSKVLLDSSWEEALARRLDDLKISWSRPTEPIIWIDSQGRNRKYFPDFYLNDFGVFLDPKNPAAFHAQREKIQFLRVNRADVLFLHSLEECRNFTQARRLRQR